FPDSRRRRARRLETRGNSAGPETLERGGDLGRMRGRPPVAAVDLEELGVDPVGEAPAEAAIDEWVVRRPDDEGRAADRVEIRRPARAHVDGAPIETEDRVLRAVIDPRHGLDRVLA